MSFYVLCDHTPTVCSVCFACALTWDYVCCMLACWRLKKGGREGGPACKGDYFWSRPKYSPCVKLSWWVQLYLPSETKHTHTHYIETPKSERVGTAWYGDMVITLSMLTDRPHSSGKCIHAVTDSLICCRSLADLLCYITSIRKRWCFNLKWHGVVLSLVVLMLHPSTFRMCHLHNPHRNVREGKTDDEEAERPGG